MQSGVTCMRWWSCSLTVQPVPNHSIARSVLPPLSRCDNDRTGVNVNVKDERSSAALHFAGALVAAAMMMVVVVVAVVVVINIIVAEHPYSPARNGEAR